MRSRLLFLCAALATLPGCASLVFSAATETAILASQERSIGAAVDDASILIEIKHLYIQKDVNDLLNNVLVKVIEGRVLLTGEVNTIDTQIEAVRLAWLADGVKEVINEIHVNDKTDVVNYAQDVWISTQIRSRFLFGKGIHPFNFSVITVNGVVYLMGIARTQDELDRVAHVAATTKYVRRVVSHIRMKDDPRRGEWSREAVMPRTYMPPSEKVYEYPSQKR